jgi:hypothetical protein
VGRGAGSTKKVISPSCPRALSALFLEVRRFLFRLRAS